MKTVQHIIPNLSREEKDRVRSILEMENATPAIETLAQPAPAGIGIRMSNATLSRLKQKLESEAILCERGDIREQANALAREEKNQDLRLAAATLLREKSNGSKPPDGPQQAPARATDPVVGISVEVNAVFS